MGTTAEAAAAYGVVMIGGGSWEGQEMSERANELARKQLDKAIREHTLLTPEGRGYPRFRRYSAAVGNELADLKKMGQLSAGEFEPAGHTCFTR